MNKVKDNQKKTVGHLWEELIEQERDFLLFLFFPKNPNYKSQPPDLERFKSIELSKIELYLKNELISQQSETLRETLLRLILTKINQIKR